MADIFADRLRTARESRKMSQSDLAKETGLRSPSFANLKTLSDALNVTTDYLIGRSDDMHVSSAVSSKLLRHAEKMSNEDLDTITRMAEMMAKKQTKKE